MFHNFLKISSFRVFKTVSIILLVIASEKLYSQNDSIVANVSTEKGLLVADSLTKENSIDAITANKIEKTDTGVKIDSISANDIRDTVSVEDKPNTKIEKLPEVNSGEYIFRQTWNNVTDIPYRCVKIYDVDSDGKNEIVLSTENAIYLFTVKNSKLEKISEYKVKSGIYIVSVDIADFAGNGVPHLFVSAINSGRSSCKSLILEYKNGSFNIVQKNIGNFFKLVVFRNGIMELYAQATPKGSENQGVVYTMIYSNKKYVTKNRIKPLDLFPIFSLNYFNGLTPSTSYYSCYNKDGNLLLLNTNNYNVEYESKDKFGGSPEYLVLSTNDSGDEDRLYVSPSILVSDLNGDGRPEVIVVKNHETFNNMMASLKFFSRSHIEIFNVENSTNVTSKWSSSKLTGYISGFDYGDFDNDGRKELIVIKVIKSGDAMFQKSKVEITAYSLWL